MGGPDRKQIIASDQVFTSEYKNLDWDLKDSELEKTFEFTMFGPISGFRGIPAGTACGPTFGPLRGTLF